MRMHFKLDSLVTRPWYSLLAIFFVLQVAFWQQTHDLKPDLTIVPEPPSSTAASALAMGDDQFMFRYLSIVLQNSGDTWGRMTPLKLYDPKKLSKWFYLMDALDAKSNVMPSMAAYYFSLTQNTPDVRYMANYLYDHSMRDVKTKWWWLLQAMYLANYKLKDKELELKVAKPLMSEGVPVWAQQMVAVVHEKRGEFEDALHIMESIRDNAETLEEKDLKYMQYFVEERIHRLDEFEKSARKKAKATENK
jgi:hypothetical protein